MFNLFYNKMIARCHYTNDFKSVYVDNYVVRLPKLKRKSFIVIYHNVTEMDGLNFYNEIIDNLSEYKTIYTSEPSTIYYTPLDENKNCNSNFDITQLDKILNFSCVCSDILYVVLVITPHSITLPRISNLSVSIQCINLNQINNQIPENLQKHKIKIKDTNISKELIGSTYDFEDSQLVIFICSTNLPNFSNWIKYTFDGFDEIENFQDVMLLTDPDIEAQIIGLKNVIEGTLTKDKFDRIKTKFLHTIGYYNSFLNYNEKIRLSELISSANIVFSMIQNNIMYENLSQTNLADTLFSKSIKSTPNFVTWKQSKTFVSNKIKIGKVNKKLNPIDESIKSSPLFIKSLDQYTSGISLSNWYDEYENSSCLGLLVNIQTEHSDRMGWTTDTINVKVTNTLIGRDQIYDGHEYFWNQNNCLDNGKMQTNLISGSGIGSGNSLLPLYINKYHWESAKNYLEEQISISITQNPYLFKPTMLGLYSHVLIKIISEIVTSGCPTPLIKSLVWIALTIKKINLNLSSFQNQDIKVYLSDYFSRWIESSELELMSQTQIFKIYEDITRYNMRKDFKTKKDIQFLSPIDILNFSVNKQNITDFENFIIFTSLPINKYIRNLIDQSEESYGYLDDSSLDLIEFKNTIKSNEKFFKIQDIFPNVNYQTAIQVFTYQTFLSRTPKLKSRLESSIGLIDFTSDSLTDEMVSNHLVKLNGIIG
jgi:hypothetical protein